MDVIEFDYGDKLVSFTATQKNAQQQVEPNLTDTSANRGRCPPEKWLKLFKVYFAAPFPLSCRLTTRWT